jgi:hypothetical protein
VAQALELQAMSDKEGVKRRRRVCPSARNGEHFKVCQMAISMEILPNIVITLDFHRLRHWHA